MPNIRNILRTTYNAAVRAGEYTYNFSSYIAARALRLGGRITELLGRGTTYLGDLVDRSRNMNPRIKAGIVYLAIALSLIAPHYKSCENFIIKPKERAAKIEEIIARKTNKRAKQEYDIFNEQNIPIKIVFDDIYDFYNNFRGLNDKKKKELIAGYLKQLWDEKCSKAELFEDCKNLEARILGNVKIEKISLNDLRNEIKDVIDYVNEKYIEKKGDVFYLRKINPDIFIALMMGEIFPSKNGAKNLKTLEGLLEEGGVYLLEYYPALHDSYLSFGLYQLTSKVVNANNGTANKMAEELNIDLPGSMINITSRKQQHIATYLNMLYILERTPERRLNSFNEEDYAAFLGVAHYKPQVAKRKPIKYLKRYHYGKKLLANYYVLNPEAKKNHENEFYKLFKEIRENFNYVVRKGKNLINKIMMYIKNN